MVRSRLDTAVATVGMGSVPQGGRGRGLALALIRFPAGAVVALLVAILVAILVAVIVAASALALMLVARYVDIGAIGPFPGIYDPVRSGEKALAAIGACVASLAAIAGFALVRATRRTR